MRGSGPIFAGIRAAAAVALLGAVPGWAGGCVALEAALKPHAGPTVRLRDVQLRGLGLHQVTLLLNLDVTNRYDSDLPILGTDFLLRVEGQPLLRGRSGPAPSVPGRGRGTLEVPVEVRYRELRRTVTAARLGRVLTYAIDLTLWADAPLLGRIELPLRHEGRLPLPAPPAIDVVQVRWPSRLWSRWAAVACLELRNRNEFPVDIEALYLRLGLGPSVVLALEIDGPRHFDAGATTRVDVLAQISPSGLGQAAAAWFRGAGVAYTLSGACRLVTPYGTLDAPLWKSGWMGPPPDPDPPAHSSDR